MNDETILVIDDNRQLADFVAKELLPQMGYNTHVVYRGRDALDAILEFQPSLILLDLEMPDISGLDLLRELVDRGHKIPTIINTAHGSEQVAADAFRLGVHDYLVKPVDADQLNEAISRALTESRLRENSVRLTGQLKERVEWLTVISKIGQSVTSTLNLSEVLRRIVEAGIHLTQAEGGFLALLDPKSGQLYLRAAKSGDEDESNTTRLPVKDPFTREVIKTGRPLRLPEEPGDSQIKVSTGILVHSLLHVPILSKGQVLGVLSVDNRVQTRSFTPNDETMLTSLADYAAVALENASLYQQAKGEIAERKRIEQALRDSEERYALAVQGANDGIWDWNLKTKKVFYSSRWKSMLGYEDDEIGESLDEWFDRIHPKDVEDTKLDLSAHVKGATTHFENEFRMRHKDGTYRWMLSRGLAVKNPDGSASRVAGSQTDISARKTAETKLLHDAFFDKLTGLPNRALFMDRLNSAIERSKRRDNYIFAVLFLDLDRFKDVNDSLGHEFGDQLLIAVAGILRASLRATDTVARLGGDEFVVLLEDIKDEVDAARISGWIIEKFSSPVRLVKNEVFITTSIGIVVSTLGYERPEDILRDADISLYAAKSSGRGTYEIFHPTMRERILNRLSMESELRRALDDGQLKLFYQPIVSFDTGDLVGFEALIRWEHPQRGLILPGEFIPLAQETGLIISIDWWVLEEACRQMKAWQDRFPHDPPLTVHVNLTSKQLAQPTLFGNIKTILEKTNFDNHNLGLEITEDSVMENSQAVIDVIKELGEMNIRVYIDDFGKGYSSLGYLHQFPIGALKIDRSFITGGNEKIIRAIVSLAHDLEVDAYVEGVETEQQLALSKAAGCDYGQGFLMSKPLDVKDAEVLLGKISKENGDPPPQGDVDEL